MKLQHPTETADGNTPDKRPGPDALGCATFYLEMGWCPIPIPAGRKGPSIDGWQNLRLTADDLPGHFGNGGNIGVILGAASNGLCDVDLDCDEAIGIAARFLPETGMKHGRASTPQAHWWYYCADADPKKFEDPDPPAGAGKMLVELRSSSSSKGWQTMVPPSVHPETGEQLEWNGEFEPAAVSAAVLQQAVSRIAAVALIARRWMRKGRHDLALPLAGFLARRGVAQADAEAFIAAICAAAQDEESQDRLQAVRDTYARSALGERITGGGTLAECVGDRVVDRLTEWLGLNGLRGSMCYSPASNVAGPAASPHDPDLPVIFASCQVLPEVTEQCWAALGQANHPPRLFRHGGIPVRLERDDADAPLLRELDVDRLRHELARAADWRARKQVQGEWKEMPAKPPLDVVRDLLATPEPPLPILMRIVEVPIVGADGTLHLSPGYHEGARFYYAPPKGLVIPEVEREPTPEQVSVAVDIILELICDFPFVDDADRAHAVALFLLPFVRDLIDGPTPNHLIEAPTPGCGKGLLAEALLIPAVGRHQGVVAWTSDDDELRKRITAQLREGRTAILFDNVTRSLESGVLAAALTALTWDDRILGRSETVRVPVRCAWVTTANNPTMSTEIARRSVRIRLDPRTDRPWLRTDFKHPDLRLWAHEHRGRLIWAALTLARAWLAAGKPHPKQRPLGSYEKWTAVVGGMLEHAGIPGFLANLNEFYERADLEGTTWRNFVDAWWERFREDDVGTSELFPLALEMDGFDLGKGSEQSQRTAFGKQLGKQRDRVIGDHRVVLAGKAKRANRWQLVPIAAQAAAPLESGEHGEHR